MSWSGREAGSEIPDDGKAAEKITIQRITKNDM